MERDLDNQALRNAHCGASLKCENRRERALDKIPVPRHFQWTNQTPLSSIPKGLNHPAQGWPIHRGLPWEATSKLINPERVESQRLINSALRDGGMPTRERSAPTSAWSCRHCPQDCAPAALATLGPMPPPPGQGLRRFRRFGW